jgi:stage II sporulation protein D
MHSRPAYAARTSAAFRLASCALVAALLLAARPSAAQPSGVTAATPYRLEAEPTFDIALAVDLDSLTVQPSEEAALSWRAPDGAERTIRTPEAVRLRVSGAQVLVQPLGRSRAVPLALLEARDTLWIGDETSSSGEKALLGWNAKHWRGRFKVFLNPRGRLTLVTRLTLERYLLGVVPGEIGALRDSLLEAGRAQAIAARSYTLFYKGRRGAEGFDLYGTVEDQLYGSQEVERPLATRCVESTRGRVSTWQGAPIRANYCSTCGGITAEVWEAWPTAGREYLQSVPDRGTSNVDWCANSPQYRWRETWSAEEFAGEIARFAPGQGIVLPPAGVGELRDVQVEQRSRSARAWRLRVTTSTGEIVLPAYSIRQVLRRPGNPNAILRSNLFKIAARRGDQGRVVEVIASGAGSGHGVGLCQTGALAMAKEGVPAEAILAHYYIGTQVLKLY